MLKPLLDNGRYFEAPRWHGGRLWFADCTARTILSLEPGSAVQQVCRIEDDIPCGLGFLPTGELIIVAMFRRRLLKFSGGKVSLHADLADIAAGTIDDMIIDGAGRTYVGDVGDLGFDLRRDPVTPKAGRLILVPPVGKPRVAAEGLDFPNGIAVAADGTRLVVAESEGDCLSEFAIAGDGSLGARRRFASFGEPDGLCLDSAGAAWVALFKEDAFVRVDRSGRELQRIAAPRRRGIACALGGATRRTLYCLSALTSHEDLKRGKSAAWIDTIEVEVPGAGFP